MEAERTLPPVAALTVVVVWFDPADPQTLALFERLPEALVGCSYVVDYQPLPGPAASAGALALLRLLLACRHDGRPNRDQCETVLRHAAQHAGALQPLDLAALAAQLRPARDPQSAEVDAALRAALRDAAQRGVVQLPCLELPAVAGRPARLFAGSVAGEAAVDRLAASLRGQSGGAVPG